MLMQRILVWALHKLLNFDFVLRLFFTKEDTERVSNYFHRRKYVYIELKRHGMWRIGWEALEPRSPLFYRNTAFIQLCKYSNLFGKCVDYYLK
jgi:hypothetical protein